VNDARYHDAWITSLGIAALLNVLFAWAFAVEDTGAMALQPGDTVEIDSYHGDGIHRTGVVEAVHPWGVTLRDRVKEGETAPYRAYRWDRLRTIQQVEDVSYD
jgi:hypothetical protein